jgi:putative oxidoreductase
MSAQRSTQNVTELFGRIALSLVFLGSAVNKVQNFEGTRQYMEAKGMPATTLLLIGAIAFELFGGLAVATGFKARLGALLLIVFLVPATLIFHVQPGNQAEMIQVMKNLAILGGLLVVAANGSGSLSLDRRLQKKESRS